MARSRGRLSRSEDFARVYRTGKSVANKYLVLYYFERPETSNRTSDEGPRVGLSVSKRVGAAVDRNRVKRVLREAVRSNADLVSGNVDFVVIARPPIVDLLESDGFAAVEAKLVEVFRKASLFGPREERKSLS
ncbi:MAG: ribonuclease P protein component [Actinobacteria bacterium]|nr:ribonuclease P protein component [Actinomycetota bacterium]